MLSVGLPARKAARKESRQNDGDPPPAQVSPGKNFDTSLACSMVGGQIIGPSQTRNSTLPLLSCESFAIWVRKTFSDPAAPWRQSTRTSLLASGGGARCQQETFSHAIGGGGSPRTPPGSTSRSKERVFSFSPAGGGFSFLSYALKRCEEDFSQRRQNSAHP